MKNIIYLLCTIMLVTVLSACQQDESVSDGQDNDSNEKVMVDYTTDSNKTIKIPKNPQRIAVLASSYFGNLAALDANIVGADQFVEQSKLLKKEMKDVEVIETGNIEQVMNLNPDLIITYDTDENLKQLQKIAPTIPIKYEKWNYLDIHEELGRIVGKEDEAKKWVKQWKKTLAEDKEKVTKALGENTSISVMEQYAKDIYVYGTNWGRGTEILYQGLGLDVPAQTKKDVVETGWEKISVEEIKKYSGDYMFIGTGGSGSDNAYRDTAIWKNLNAVKNDQVIEYSSDIYYFNDPISLEYQRKDIVKALTK